MTKLLKEFFESDIQDSDFLKKELLEIIKKAQNGEKQEFIGNSFEVIFDKNEVFLTNQFTEEKEKISLKEFKKKLFNKKDFLEKLKKFIKLKKNFF